MHISTHIYHLHTYLSVMLTGNHKWLVLFIKELIWDYTFFCRSSWMKLQKKKKHDWHTAYCSRDLFLKTNATLLFGNKWQFYHYQVIRLCLYPICLFGLGYLVGLLAGLWKQTTGLHSLYLITFKITKKMTFIQICWKYRAQGQTRQI